MHRPKIGGAALAGLVVVSFVDAQGESVLDLQKSYHLGNYSGTVAVPSGHLELLAGFGDMDLRRDGSVVGQLDVYEVDAVRTVFTPNDSFSADYSVRSDGSLVFDFDPTNPGTDLLGAWIDGRGAVIHSARNNADIEAFSILAIEKSTGSSAASLNGRYYFSSQRMEFAGTDWNTFGQWGIATFDGRGGGTINSTELATTPTGSTIQSVTGSFRYTVAADGSLTLDGSPGAVSATGELLFVVQGDATSGEVGMTIAVRIGTGYDFRGLGERYSLSGQGYSLGTGAFSPRTTTDFGELELAASSATAGLWNVSGVTVDGTPQGITQNPLAGGGRAVLGASGLMTLTDAVGSIELGFSATGDYCVGRVVEPATNLFFGFRQCAPSNGYGTATAGTGGEDPKLGMKTFPTLGNSSWTLVVSDALGGGVGAVAVGAMPSPGLPALGGLLWIDPAGIVFAPSIALSGSAGVAGAGRATTPIPVPGNPTLAGIELFCQALILDPAAPGGIAMSSGFRAELCR